MGLGEWAAFSQEPLQVYTQAGGVAPVYDAVGRTDLAHSLGLLSQCPVMLANDTGLMHWGGVGGVQGAQFVRGVCVGARVSRVRGGALGHSRGFGMLSVLDV